MFFIENWHFSNNQEQARRLRPEMDALSYVFGYGHASASMKDVTEVASFFYLKMEDCFKILIVEDDEISRSIYRLMLKNFKLTFCESDKTMYEKLSKDTYQLIIMDIGLPNSKDGLTLIKELKVNKDFFKIPIICITSYDSNNQKDNVLNAGAEIYLVKPVPRNFLIDAIIKFQL